MGPHLCHLLNAWGAAAGQPMDRGQRLLVLHRAVADMVGQQTTVGFRAMAMICWEQMSQLVVVHLAMHASNADRKATGHGERTLRAAHTYVVHPVHMHGKHLTLHCTMPALNTGEICHVIDAMHDRQGSLLLATARCVPSSGTKMQCWLDVTQASLEAYVPALAMQGLPKPRSCGARRRKRWCRCSIRHARQQW